MPGWVTLDELVNDLELSDANDAEDLSTEDAERLGRRLDAAVEFVERIHKGRFNFNGDPGSTLPAPGETLKLGTLMLARRWNTRRRSPDMLVAMGELGAARVSSGDPDVDRLLRLGKHARPRVG